MKSGRPRCVTCTYRCPRKRERVRNRTHRDRDPSATMLCATNNITYPSWCHIVKDACVTGFVLETRHAGPCNAYDTSPLYIGKSSTRDYVDNTRLLVNEYCCSSRSLFKLSLYSSSRCWTRTYSNIRIILDPFSFLICTLLLSLFLSFVFVFENIINEIDRNEIVMVQLYELFALHRMSINNKLVITWETFIGKLIRLLLF